MSRNNFTPEQIIKKLREAEVLQSKGEEVRIWEPTPSPALTMANFSEPSIILPLEAALS